MVLIHAEGFQDVSTIQRTSLGHVFLNTEIISQKSAAFQGSSLNSKLTTSIEMLLPF